jgi:hypothetical protein
MLNCFRANLKALLRNALQGAALSRAPIILNGGLEAAAPWSLL